MDDVRQAPAESAGMDNGPNGTPESVPTRPSRRAPSAFQPRGWSKIDIGRFGVVRERRMLETLEARILWLRAKVERDYGGRDNPRASRFVAEISALEWIVGRVLRDERELRYTREDRRAVERELEAIARILGLDLNIFDGSIAEKVRELVARAGSAR